MSFQKNDPKIVRAWCMYDWANSVYSLTITTAVFPAYFLSVTKSNLSDGSVNEFVDFFGYTVKNSVLYSYGLSFAFLLAALLNPFLSGIADHTGSKKRFMQFFSTLGAISCAMLFFFEGENIEYGMICFVLAGLGYAGSLVYYNAFLPDIATEDQFDKISARGFSLGYIGSVILLVVNLVTILKPELFGIDPNNRLLPPKISFLTVGLWWFGFAAYSFYNLPNHVAVEKKELFSFISGFKELMLVRKQISVLPFIKPFLIAFFMYSMGVQTVMYLATIFGEQVVGLKMEMLIMVVLILQLVAIGGAYGFSYLSSKIGNIKTLAVSLTVWVFVCIAAYFIGNGDTLAFFVLAGFVGLVMGGVQSLSRSTYSKFIPADSPQKSSYYSFYEFVEKIAIVLGTFVYGLIEQLTGSMNNSALCLTLFFIVGIIILVKIPSKKEYHAHVEK